MNNLSLILSLNWQKNVMKKMEPRPQNRILVPLWSSFRNFRGTAASFLHGSLLRWDVLCLDTGIPRWNAHPFADPPLPPDPLPFQIISFPTIILVFLSSVSLPICTYFQAFSGFTSVEEGAMKLWWEILGPKIGNFRLSSFPVFFITIYGTLWQKPIDVMQKSQGPHIIAEHQRYKKQN